MNEVFYRLCRACTAEPEPKLKIQQSGPVSTDRSADPVVPASAGSKRSTSVYVSPMFRVAGTCAAQSGP